ncbi:MAG: phosphonate C-P lyase system protein PhnH, partial [Pseudomonadota bacterium]|nr:phosphonate C-P lyase system protein PhnH [Pseudomonadota bacterium]
MTTADISTLTPGLNDPVFDGQAIFRALLMAMAAPGRVRSVPATVEGPVPLTPAAAGVALAMFDLATPVWLAPPIDNPAVRGFLAFHCRCPIASDPAAAAFAIVDAAGAEDLAQFAPGTPEYPDRSTTVLVQVDGLMEAPGVRLSGPGIERHHDLRVAGVGKRFWAAQAANAACFP